MPTWVLFALPTLSITGFWLAITFGSNPIVVAIAGAIAFFSIAVELIAVPVTILALTSSPPTRTTPRLVGVAFCSLPILGIISAVMFGGI
ncbi:hypothetical protein [Lysobacter tyrosinilyticus]